MDFSSENRQTAEYLWSISRRLSETCPAASRFYMCNFERKLIDDSSLSKTSAKRRYLYCNHCGSMWTVGNHQVRVKPPPSRCRRVRSMFKGLKRDPTVFTKEQRKTIKKFEKRTSKIVYTCFVCKKNTEFPVKPRPSRRLKQSSPITPVPKVNWKKRDVNAGLLVTTPSEDSKDERVSHCQDDLLNSSGIWKESETLVTESEDVNNSCSSEKLNRKFSTPGYFSKLPAKRSTPYSSPSTTTQVRKNILAKRKSLTAQLLNEEPKAKKKSSISSFLVNL